MTANRRTIRPIAPEAVVEGGDYGPLALPNDLAVGEVWR